MYLRRLRQTMRLAHWSVCPSQVAPMTRGSVDLDDSVHRVLIIFFQTFGRLSLSERRLSPVLFCSVHLVCSSLVYYFTTFISPVLSLTTRIVTTGAMHLLYYSFVLFLAFLLFTRSHTLRFCSLFLFCLFFCLVTLNSIQVLQPSLCALSTSRLFSILFIPLHYLI